MTNWGLSGLGLYRKDDDDERLDDNHNDDDDEGDDDDDDEGDGKDNHVLALKGWMDPVAQYQPLESQSLQATSNNMSSHIIISATHKSTRKRTKSAIMWFNYYLVFVQQRLKQ